MHRMSLISGHTHTSSRSAVTSNRDWFELGRLSTNLVFVSSKKPEEMGDWGTNAEFERGPSASVENWARPVLPSDVFLFSHSRSPESREDGRLGDAVADVVLLRIRELSNPGLVDTESPDCKARLRVCEDGKYRDCIQGERKNLCARVSGTVRPGVKQGAGVLHNALTPQ